MKLFTIGFTKTSAENFFRRIKDACVSNVIDIRISNTSQLSGFSKRDDLQYFLKNLLGAGYLHDERLAPTKDLMRAYRGRSISWEQYQRRFRKLMEDRRIEDIDREALNEGCLLCSEDKPHQCHRRLVAEYLNEKWGDVEIVHL